MEGVKSTRYLAYTNSYRINSEHSLPKDLMRF